MAINEKLIEQVYKNLCNGGIIYAIGNGGSSAEASHLIAELIGKFRKERNPIRAVALTDPSVITCIANDFGYENIFSRQLEALLTCNDILFAFTTSGKSKNILEALKVASNKRCLTICVCGSNYSHLENVWILPTNDDVSIADKVQEIHIQYVHEFVEKLEKYL
jgi:D-sedoheptulose 7-phosphate isomerase